MLREDERFPQLDKNTLQNILPEVDINLFVNNYTAFLSEDGQVILLTIHTELSISEKFFLEIRRGMYVQNAAV